MIKRIALTAAIAALVLSIVPEAFAAKGGGGKGGGGATTSSSFKLVLLDSTDGYAHWGQRVTFTVSTSATSEPNVSLTCSQNGAVVYGAVTGYYASYPWPWTQTMTLSSADWTAGAASCVAKLYYFSGTSTVNLGSMSFTARA